MSHDRGMRFREFSTDRLVDFRRAGYRSRHFFPHRAFYLPKSVFDGYKFAYRSGLHPKPDQMWEAVLFALPSAIEGLPTELFFDDEIIWHRQQFGLEGQVAAAGMTICGSDLYTSMHHSDVVQRISRRRQLKTRVEKVFDGWDRLLLNSILRFAVERGLETVRVPTAAHARAMADPGRDVKAELFERIYDRHVGAMFDVRPTRNWWVIDVAANRDRIVAGAPKTESITSSPTICVCHDIERGLGHTTVEPAFAEIADVEAPGNLVAMLVRGRRFASQASRPAVRRRSAQPRSRVSQPMFSWVSVAGRMPLDAGGESSTRADSSRAAAVASMFIRFNRAWRRATSAISGTSRRLSRRPTFSGSWSSPSTARACSSAGKARKGPESCPTLPATAARHAR